MIEVIESWLAIEEISEVVNWSHKFLAHAADAQQNPIEENTLRPPIEKIAAAQKAIVRAAEAISACLLHMPSHMAIVPVYQFSKFWRFDRFVSSEVVPQAASCWNSLEDDRNNWTQGVYETLIRSSHSDKSHARSLR